MDINERDIVLLVVGAVLGGLIGYFTPGTFYDTQFYKRWRFRRENKMLEDQFNSSNDTFRLGPFQVCNMLVLQLLHGLREDEIITIYNQNSRRINAVVKTHAEVYVASRKKELVDEGRTVDYNDTYSLRKIIIKRPQVNNKDRNRRNTLELEFEPSNFKYNLMLNEALDEPLLRLKDGTIFTIREYLCLIDFEWSKLPDIPIHMWFSTVVGVVTSDDRFVLPLRSGMQAIYSPDIDENYSWGASMSCGEGMLRPVDKENGRPTPFKTAKRALSCELGLEMGEHYISKDIRLIAMCFDTFRYQPLAVFILKLDDVSFDDVYQCWQSAPDRHENNDLIPIKVDPFVFADLLLGKVAHKSRKVVLFSNHQEIGTALIGCKLFKIIPMVKALKTNAKS